MIYIYCQFDGSLWFLVEGRHSDYESEIEFEDNDLIDFDQVEDDDYKTSNNRKDSDEPITICTIKNGSNESYVFSVCVCG